MSKIKVTLAEADALENTTEELGLRFCCILCKLVKPLSVILSFGVAFVIFQSSNCNKSSTRQTGSASDWFIPLLTPLDRFQWLIWLRQVLCILTLIAFLSSLRLEAMREKAHKIRDEFLKERLVCDSPAFELVNRLNEFFHRAAKTRAFELFLLVFTSGPLVLIPLHERWFGNQLNAFLIELLILLIGISIVFALEMNLMKKLVEAYEGTSKRNRHAWR